MGKVVRVGDAFSHLVTVLDMFMEILDSRVEDVRKRVTSQVLHCDDSVDFCIRVFLFDP